MRSRLFLCTILLAGTPQPAAAEGPAFFALSVPDLDASVRWYAEMLDLEPTRLPGSDQVQVALLQGEALIVELIQHSAAVAPEKQLPDLQKRYLLHGLFKSGFFVADLDATIARLEARGARFRGDAFTDEILGARSILLLDNAGNVIQLFQRTRERAAGTASTPSGDLRRPADTRASEP